MRNNTTHRTSDERGIILSCLISQGIWFISAVVLLLLMCSIAYSTADPDSLTLPLSLCTLYLSAVAGGFAAVRISGDGIMSGLISGIITASIVFILSSLPIPESGFEFSKSVMICLSQIPASMLGSLIGHKRKKRKSPTRRK